MGRTLLDLKHGTVIDSKYRVEAFIGSGGMGAVYEATQLITHRKVAIKLMHSVYTDDREVLERFNREAELAGSIGHDNICEVTDVGTLQNGAPYMVMPLLRGESLADLLSERRPMEIGRCIDILCQVLSALDAAHHAKVVHRDLKPANILITRVGDREDFVKLLDFGICKILDEKAYLELTASGMVLGTPYYMAPEQAMGSKYLDHRVDIYAAGVILYEALTGKRPFNGDSYNEVMFKIASEPFPAPATVNPSITTELDRVVLKAMSRHPMDRYSSAREMQNVLKAAHLGLETPPAERLATSMSSTVAESVVSFAPDIERDKRASFRKILTVAALALFAALAIAMIAIVVGILAGNNEQVEEVPATQTIDENPTTERTKPKKIEVSEDTTSAEKVTTQPNRATPSAPLPDSKSPSVADEKSPLPAVLPKKVGKNTPAPPQRGVKRPVKKRSATQDNKSVDNDVDKPGSAEKGSVKGRFGTRIVEDF